MYSANSVLYSLILLAVLGAAPALAQPQSGGMMQGMQEHHGAGEKDRHHGWKAGLDDKQRAELDSIKADYMKKSMPLKAKAKALKVELMALALADAPDSGAIDKKIDEMVEIKRELLRLKADKVSATRKMLDAQQRARYDIHVMRKASHSGRHHGAGKPNMGAMGMSGMGMGRGMGGCSSGTCGMRGMGMNRMGDTEGMEGMGDMETSERAGPQ